MRKLPAIALAGLGAAVLAGGAYAAGPKTHIMNVPLVDGSSIRIEYVGDVAPKVTVAPATLNAANSPWLAAPFPSFAGFDRMFDQIDRQMRQIEQMARQPGAAPGMNVAAYGSMPPGTSSYSVSTVSDGTCTRTTEVVSQGTGKPPKVTTRSSGNCAPAAAAPPGDAPPTGPLDRT